MTELSSKSLKGIWCSIQLHIQQDNSIDYIALGEEIEYLTNTSVQGLYSNGTAAEFYNQTESEFDRISELLATCCHNKNRPFQIGASHMSPILSLERIKRTKSLQPNAFQVILPDWLKLNAYEISAFLTRIVETADPIPIVLYNPGHSKTFLTPSDLKHLSDKFPQIIGVKTGGGTPEWHREIRSHNMNPAIFVPGHKLATGIKETVAQGSYSNMACLHPDATQRWYETILSNLDEGLKTEQRIRAFFTQCIIPLSSAGYSDAALDKLLWSLRERKNTSTRLRWPYREVDQNYIAEIRETGRRIIPEFFEST